MIVYLVALENWMKSQEDFLDHTTKFNRTTNIRYNGSFLKNISNIPDVINIVLTKRM